MIKKINALLFVLLYIVIYFLAHVIALTARPLSDTLLHFLSGEHNFFRLFEYFIYQTEGQKLDMISLYLISMLLTVLIIWIILYIRKKPVSDYISKRRMTLKEVLASLFLAYGLNVAATAIISIPALESFMPSYESTMESIAMGNIYIMLLVVGIIAPAFEELFFRGIVYGELKSAGSFFFANIIQSVLFGVMHMNVIQGIYAAAIGFIFGFVYYKTKNIYVTILTHTLFNASNIIAAGVLYYAQSMPFYYFSGVLTLYIGFWLILNKRQLDKNLS